MNVRTASVPAAAPPPPGSLAVLACRVLEDELHPLLSSCAAFRRIEWLPQGLHNEPARLHAALQAAIDTLEADPAVEAIALAYGLCSRSVEGLAARRVRLVIPRAHDCITLLLGSAERYADCVRRHPGTYWYSPGWNRSGGAPGPERERRLREDFAARFDPEDAAYLMEAERHWMQAYQRACYIGSGAENDAGRAYAERCAAAVGWEFAWERGDSSLLRALLGGPWDERFAVVAPGETFQMTADERVLTGVSSRCAGCSRGPAPSLPPAVPLVQP